LLERKTTHIHEEPKEKNRTYRTYGKNGTTRQSRHNGLAGKRAPDTFRVFLIKQLLKN